jgi:hypothetical protein
MVEYGLVSLVGWPMGYPLGSPPCCVTPLRNGGVRSGEPGGLAFGWLAGLLRIENTGPDPGRSLRFGGGLRHGSRERWSTV